MVRPRLMAAMVMALTGTAVTAAMAMERKAAHTRYLCRHTSDVALGHAQASQLCLVEAPELAEQPHLDRMTMLFINLIFN